MRIQRALSGRRSGGRCVKPTRRLRNRGRCTRYVMRATLRRTHRSAGAKQVAFSGRVGSRALAAGSYRLRVTAAAGAGTTSPTRTITFTIARR